MISTLVSSFQLCHLNPRILGSCSHTLESLNPRILEPFFSSIELKKTTIIYKEKLIYEDLFCTG